MQIHRTGSKFKMHTHGFYHHICVCKQINSLLKPVHLFKFSVFEKQEEAASRHYENMPMQYTEIFKVAKKRKFLVYFFFIFFSFLLKT